MPNPHGGLAARVAGHQRWCVPLRTLLGSAQALTPPRGHPSATTPAFACSGLHSHSQNHLPTPKTQTPHAGLPPPRCHPPQPRPATTPTKNPSPAIPEPRQPCSTTSLLPLLLTDLGIGRTTSPRAENAATVAQPRRREPPHHKYLISGP